MADSARARRPAARPRGPAERVTAVFTEFFGSQVAGSVLLLIATVAALAWANSPWWESYEALLELPLGLTLGEERFTLSLHYWVNDGLMAIFFFLVGLEIKRELVVGELSSVRRAVLPAAAALGGMVVPALIYFALNRSGEAARGWGIPMATDIAFSIGVLALLGKRAPLGLRIFLTAFAIVDDLGAVLVIAIFYTDSVNWLALTADFVLLAVVALLAWAGVRRIAFYIGLGVLIWFLLFLSGVHATVAGVLMAALVPVKARQDPARFLRVGQKHLDALQRSNLTRTSMTRDSEQQEQLAELREVTELMTPAGMRLEHALHPWVAFFILPLFAFFNAGVRIEGGFFDLILQPVSLGVIFGLVLGKQIGITLASWLAVKSGRAALPDGVGWRMVYGAGWLGGIGFTMSIFVTELAFEDPLLINEAKVGILTASLIAGAGGYLLLRFMLPKESS